MKRPPSVWITQTLIAVFALAFASGVFRSLFSITSWVENVSFARLVFGTVVVVILLTIWGAAFWGLAKRTQWGKWFGLLALLIIWAFNIYGQLYPSQGPVKKFEYNNAAQVAGANSSQIMMHVLFIILMLRLLFSKKVNRYFQRQSDNSLSSSS